MEGTKEFIVAKETIDDIIKGEKYELVEIAPMGAYIIDESGESTYYSHSSYELSKN